MAILILLFPAKCSINKLDQVLQQVKFFKALYISVYFNRPLVPFTGLFCNSSNFTFAVGLRVTEPRSFCTPNGYLTSAVGGGCVSQGTFGGTNGSWEAITVSKDDCGVCRTGWMMVGVDSLRSCLEVPCIKFVWAELDFMTILRCCLTN